MLIAFCLPTTSLNLFTSSTHISKLGCNNSEDTFKNFAELMSRVRLGILEFTSLCTMTHICHEIILHAKKNGKALRYLWFILYLVHFCNCHDQPLPQVFREEQLADKIYRVSFSGMDRNDVLFVRITSHIYIFQPF